LSKILYTENIIFNPVDDTQEITLKDALLTSGLSNNSDVDIVAIDLVNYFIGSLAMVLAPSGGKGDKEGKRMMSESLKLSLFLMRKAGLSKFLYSIKL